MKANLYKKIFCKRPCNQVILLLDQIITNKHLDRVAFNSFMD